jgi:hypothetical protein
MTGRCIALLVRRSRSVLVQRQCIVLLHPSVFQTTNLPLGRSPRAPLLWFEPSSGFTHLARSHTDLPQECRLPAPLMEFATPSTLEPEQVHSTPVCLAGYVPPTGFLTLPAASSLPGRPALFRAGNALGVPRSSGVSPHCQVPRLVAVELPSWRFSSRCPHRSTGANEAFEPAVPAGISAQTFAAYKALLRQWIRLTQIGGPLQMIDPLLSFLSLSRVLPTTPGYVRPLRCRSCALARRSPEILQTETHDHSVHRRGALQRTPSSMVLRSLETEHPLLRFAGLPTPFPLRSAAALDTGAQPASRGGRTFPQSHPYVGRTVSPTGV